MSKEVLHIGIKEEMDDSPDTSYLVGDRLKEYQAGEFYYLGIQAKAEIIAGGVIQFITSGGLWGIESDSGDGYLKTVGAEQMEEIKAVLLELGFTPEQIVTY
jgi:hypothetical protein